MRLEQLTSIGDVRQFLEGTQAVAFGVTTSKQYRGSLTIDYHQLPSTTIND